MRAVWCITAILAADDRDGSIATEMSFRCDVRFTPDSDRTADIAGGPVRADIVAKIFLRGGTQIL